MNQQDRERPIIIVRKKVYAGGHHGGAWKVAFADFMTSLMALFLVMWIVTQSSEVRSAIAGYFNDPMGHGNQFGTAILPGIGPPSATVRPLSPRQLLDIRAERLQQLQLEIERSMQEDVQMQAVDEYVDVRITDDGLQIELLESQDGVFFESGSATLSAKGVTILRMVAQELREMSNPVVIEGHTDAIPFVGRAGYGNWELSTDRANTARRVLTTNGVAAERILEIRGHADRRLRNPDQPAAAENRRVTIRLLDNHNLAADGVAPRESGG